MRALTRKLIVAVATPLMLGGCYLLEGGWMDINPKYKEERLIGLTQPEVVQRLGTPYWDPKSQKAYTTRPWDEEEDGLYYVMYAQGYNRCVISFKDGKVVAAKRNWK